MFPQKAATVYRRFHEKFDMIGVPKLELSIGRPCVSIEREASGSSQRICLGSDVAHAYCAQCSNGIEFNPTCAASTHVQFPSHAPELYYVQTARLYQDICVALQKCDTFQRISMMELRISPLGPSIPSRQASDNHPPTP
jgi:hypothetical protein